MAYQEFQTCTDPVFESRKIVDADGTALYETQLVSLLHEIIARNDSNLLMQYITAWEWDLPGRDIPVPDIHSHDPFYIAAAHGCLDALRVLLDAHSAGKTEAHSASASASASIEQERGFSLLHVACQHAQIEIVKFLLDSDPALATVHDKDPGGWTPLMAAAYSTGTFGDGADTSTLGEVLINMLLDRGASARDCVSSPTTGIDTATASESGGHRLPQADSTVLSLAISGCSYRTVKRLLEAGADIHQPLAIHSDTPGSGFWDDGLDVRDVTALHLGSAAWNVEGIRAVLDHCYEMKSDMTFWRDSMGRLPLHYAAAGSDPTGTLEPSLIILENDLAQRITGTFELLVPNDDAGTAKLINTRDAQGATPLHYAVRTHGRCGTQGSKHAYRTIAWLLSHGGNASIGDGRNRTALHVLAYASLDGEPIDTNLITLLMKYGCPLDTPDEDGETPLHILARHLRQAHAAKELIKHGARVDVVNKKGNLPLHEAMRGAIRPRLSWDCQRQEQVSLGDRVRAQDEVVRALLDVHGTTSVLDQPNGQGKTPRVLREETRRRWEEMERGTNASN
ncbi:ankyrin repeat domain-containing protein [Aspergillus mulundensis]|uniref:Uncharacterized protein n=1 Tax=Aspergillus mulundensis TaxID=1810919 RepID=A0A3D8SBA7_9EURO|nr:Uncharacterized protein DSM5745_03941 [Aspergillus mulundensis]RDW83615.1 Uncharacterized protein DSM5745_03941 [Aspergillus mulundensis]